MNKKRFYAIISLSFAATFTFVLTTTLVLNAQTYTQQISGEPQIQLSNLNSVDKTIVKGPSNSRLNDYAEFEVVANVLNKISSVEPVFSWFEKTSTGLEAPIDFSNNSIYEQGIAPNILLINANGLSDANPSSSFLTRNFFCRVSYNETIVNYSNTAALNLRIVTSPIEIIKQPLSISNAQTSQTLAVVASIKNPIPGELLTYQWYEIDANGNNILLEGQTNFSVLISYSENILTTPSEKKYFCELAYDGIKTKSSIAIVKIVGSAIDIVSQPKDIDVATPISKLSVSVNVRSPVVGVSLTYEWYQIINNVNVLLTGETKDTLSLNYTESQLNSSVINLYFCKITYGNLNLDTNVVIVKLVPSIVINTAISSFNSKPFFDKMASYKSLFNNENIAAINEEVKLAPQRDLVAQTINNMNMPHDDKNEIQNKMLSSPISIGSNGNILFTFDFLSQMSNLQFSYFINNDAANICNIDQILASQISNLEVIYLDNYFGINFTLNSSTIKGLTYSVFGQASKIFNNKQNISFTGVLSNTFNTLITTKLLNV